MDKLTLGKKLRRQRVINEMTQQEIADKIGVDRTTYAKYESGKATPNFNNIAVLSRIFGVSVTEFTDDEYSTVIDFSDSAELKDEEKKMLQQFRELSDIRKQEVLRVIHRLTLDQEREENSSTGNSWNFG